MKIERILTIVTLLAFSMSAHAKLFFEDIPKNLIESLQTKFPSINSGKITPFMADSIIRSLMQSGKFQNVAVFDQNDNYWVVGYLLKNIEDVIISGNNNIDEEKLLPLIRIQKNKKLDRKLAIESATNIKNYYGDQGYLDVKVEVSFINNDANTTDVIFKVTEGPLCRIGEISVSSENSRLNDILLNRLKKYEGDSFSTDIIKKLRDVTKEYLSDKQYLRAQLNEKNVEYNADRTRAQLQYEISQPYRYELVLRGFEKLSQYDIRRGIAIGDFEASSLDPAIEVEQKAKRLYLSKGFPHVKLHTEVKVKEDQFYKQIILHIDEGPRSKIATFNITGRISRQESFYTDFILNNSSDLLSNGYYNREDLELGYQNLVTHLKNQGYLSAKVHSARVEFNRNKDKANIQVVLDEGPLTQVRSIRFQGAREFTNDELNQAIPIKVNSPLRLNLLEESIVNLKNHYRSKGFLEMKLKNESEDLVSYSSKGTEASIVFKIHEGPLITVGSVVIEGNDFTKSEVIENEMEIEIGETLTMGRINQIVRRLNRLGYFSRVALRTVEEGTNVAKRTLVVSVSERDPGFFRTGVGVTSEDDLTLRGFVGSSYNNLLGTGRGISGRVDLQSNVTESQYLESKVSLGYTEPFIMKTRTRGRVNLTYEIEETDYDPDNKISVLKESNRADFLLVRDLTDHLKLTWTTWSIETERTFTDPGSDNTSDNRIAAIGPLFALDYRDSILSPTKGSYTRFDTQYSHPLLGSSEDVEFWKTDLRMSFYLPVSDSGIVWANNISGGYLKNLSTLEGSGVPSSRGFYLHGQAKIRGFGGSSRTEHIPNSSQFPELTDRIEGESHYYMGKTELRFPLPGSIPLNLAIFYDVGGVEFSDSDKQCVSKIENPSTNEIECVSHDPIRQSIGVGFHVITPLGPIILELARKLNPKEGERLDRIHFSIGSF